MLSPSSRLVFHTATKPTMTTDPRDRRVAARQPTVELTGHGAAGRRAASVATAPARGVAAVRRRGAAGGGAATGSCRVTIRRDGPLTWRGVLRYPHGAPTRRRSRKLLSIFFPMWNEEEYIERAVGRGHRRVRAHASPTATIARLRADHRRRRVDRPHAGDRRRARRRRRPRRASSTTRCNRKLGGAIKTGFATATGDLVLYTDADLPFDMAELPRAVRLLRHYEADICRAYRFDRTGEGYLRGRSTRSSTTCSSAGCSASRLRDINFAFKLLPRARSSTHVELRSEGSFIDAELIIRATQLGLRDAPVRRRLLPAHAG